MKINIKTTSKTQMIDITSNVAKIVKNSAVKNGIVHICSMHTTAAITINENADPDVEKDILNSINKLIPFNDNYSHMEGNSAAHIKVSLFGTSEMLALENKTLVLGTWQGIYFCEFDGPRNREVNIQIIGS